MVSFKAGDVVRLKSGGPRMTIRAVEGDECLCDWFEGNKRMSDRFDATTLEIAPSAGSRTTVARVVKG